ncbi:hypothetical protein AAC387_Pa02g3013 [Persea americana]
MDMRKITCAILFIAASASVVLAADESSALAPGPATHSGSTAVAPAVGLLGASFLSFCAFYLQ